MVFGYLMRLRTRRFLVIVCAALIYVLLLTADAMRFFPHEISSASFGWLSLASFGTSALIAVLFLAVGSLVWLYARNRWVARLIFSFSLTMMILFSIETATSVASNNDLLTSISGDSVSLALALLAILLLVFPKNYLSFRLQYTRNTDNTLKYPVNYRTFLVRGYIVVLFLLGTVSALNATWILPAWFGTLANIYSLLALTGILTTIIISYFQSPRYGRQQLRFFVAGIIIAVLPFLVLTALPLSLNLPSVDPQLSTLTVGLFPLALGYTILRYQVLTFDKYIRRSVGWMIGSVGLVVVSFLAFSSGVALFNNDTSRIIFVVSVMAVLGPVVWVFSRFITDRLFFSEMVHYRRMIDKPDMLENETFDVNGAAQLLILTAISVFETQEVCLFVLDDDTGYYQLAPVTREDHPSDDPRLQLAERVLQHTERASDNHAMWMNASETLIQRVDTSRRPLLFREATAPESEQPGGLSRYITSHQEGEKTEPLLAPVRVHGKMIGLLVLGERGDHQQYAGSDFGIVDLILSRFASVLETSRLYVRANQHAIILNSLYSATNLPVDTFESIEEIAVAYANLAADVVMAQSVIWLYHEDDSLLHYVTHKGFGPRLIHEDVIRLSDERDWSPCFSQGIDPRTKLTIPVAVPSFVESTPDYPFVWLPLKRGEKQLGALLFTYPRPHTFSAEEQRVLSIFANQVSVAIENVRMTLELRAAYERQKELDRLKDQFIMTASHELRTPLTAVQGYIELLNEYHTTISPEKQIEFIAKARRGCDELTLMVSNIMDASRIEFDVQNMQLEPVSVAESVTHIVEILEALIRREERTVQMEIPATVYVMAQTGRLRQILLNLIGNALKYSPAGTDIRICCDIDEEYEGYVTVRVQDAGFGVPREFQESLFERFVRLERDMNSPTRGAGLGLYICKQLVTAMQGRIWVESAGTPDSGSSFAFMLKRAPLPGKKKAYRLEHQGV